MKNQRKTHLLLALALLTVPQLSMSAATQDRGYITDRAGGTWFIDLGAGPGMYLGGYGDNFSDRLTNTWYLGFGKWLTPSTGIRAGMDFAHKYREFSGADKYMFYGWNIHADFLWDMLQLFGGYREGRIYHIIPYLGAGCAQTGPCSHCEETQHDYTYGSTSQSFTVTVGVINKFRLGSVVDLNLELSSALAGDRLDNLVNDRSSIDSPVAVRLGLSFNMGHRRFRKAGAYSAEKVDMAVAKALAAQEGEILALRSESERLSAENESLRNKAAADSAAGVAAKTEADSAEGSETQPESESGYAVRVGGSVITVPREAIVLFKLAHYTLGYKEYGQMHQFIEYVRRSISEGKRIELVGSADYQTGSSGSNMTLSRKRVEYIRNILIRDCGIPADRIEPVAEGDLNNRFLDPEMNRCVYVRFK